MPRGRRFGIGLLLPLLSGCALWPDADADVEELATGLPPRSAAWIAAEIARQRFPGADPIPQHAAAPAEQLAPDRFRVHLARRTPTDYRVGMNGRLRPPARLADEPPFSTRDVVFWPAPSWTRTTLRADDELWIEIEPDAGGGTRITITRRGEALDRALGPRLRSTLRLAEALDDTGALLRAGRHGAARRRATAALRSTPHAGAALGAQLRARLLLHRAVAARALGAEPAAARSIAAALAEDPACRAARAERGALDRATARQLGQRRHLRVLAATAGAPAVAQAARDSQARLGAPRHDQRAATLGGIVDHWLRRDAPGTALTWIDELHSCTEPTATTLQTQAGIYRRLGRTRDARNTALLELAEHGFRPELVLALHDDAVALGEPDDGLRWLAYYWEGFRGRHESAAQQRLQRAAERLGSGPALHRLGAAPPGHGPTARRGAPSPWLRELRRWSNPPASGGFPVQPPR